VSPAASGVKDPRMVGAVDLLGRTGATQFQVRYCEEEKPVVWMALGQWGDRWEVAAAMTPLLAVFGLCDQVIDGGKCTHCKRPTGFAADITEMPADDLICWYQWDPERSTFRRGCAGGLS
jgi:hypothetical protein